MRLRLVVFACLLALVLQLSGADGTDTASTSEAGLAWHAALLAHPAVGAASKAAQSLATRVSSLVIRGPRKESNPGSGSRFVIGGGLPAQPAVEVQPLRHSSVAHHVAAESVRTVLAALARSWDVHLKPGAPAALADQSNDDSPRPTAAVSDGVSQPSAATAEAAGCEARRLREGAQRLGALAQAACLQVRVLQGRVAMLSITLRGALAAQRQAAAADAASERGAALAHAQADQTAATPAAGAAPQGTSSSERTEPTEAGPSPPTLAVAAAANGQGVESTGPALGNPVQTVHAMMDAAATLSHSLKAASVQLELQLRAFAAEAVGGATGLPKKLLTSPHGAPPLGLSASGVGGSGGNANSLAVLHAVPGAVAEPGGAASDASNTGTGEGTRPELPQPVRTEGAADGGEEGGRARGRLPLFTTAHAMVGSLLGTQAPVRQVLPSEEDAVASLNAAFGLAQWAASRADGRGPRAALRTRGSLMGLPKVLEGMEAYEWVLQAVAAVATEVEDRARKMLSIVETLSGPAGP